MEEVVAVGGKGGGLLLWTAVESGNNRHRFCAFGELPRRAVNSAPAASGWNFAGDPQGERLWFSVGAGLGGQTAPCPLDHVALICRKRDALWRPHFLRG